MRIAIPYEDGAVYQHFGHAEQFRLYDIDDEARQITGEQTAGTNGSGHGALAGFLSGLKVDTLICGGIGAGARDALAQAGIQIFGGVSGSAADAVEAFLAGTLAYDPEARCDHHGHGEHGGGHGHCHEEGRSCSQNG